MRGPASGSELLVLVYDELRSLARSRMGHVPPRNTLQPTALVHEAYLRLTKRGDATWNGEGHFFAAASEAMRQILVEQARRKSRIKHGGERKLHALDEDHDDLQLIASPQDVLLTDDLLRTIEPEDPELATLVKLRFFAGLDSDATATVMNLSRRSVERRWRYAAALLRQRLGEPETENGDDPIA